MFRFRMQSMPEELTHGTTHGDRDLRRPCRRCQNTRLRRGHWTGRRTGSCERLDRLDPPKMVIQPSRIEISAVNNGHNGHGLSKNMVFPGILQNLMAIQESFTRKSSESMSFWLRDQWQGNIIDLVCWRLWHGNPLPSSVKGKGP